MKLRLCCPCLFGLESILSYEIRKVGGENLVVTDGKISFDGDENVLAKANLWTSVAERVLVELATFKATSFEELFQGVKAIELENFIGKDDAFPVKGYSLNSKLHSIPDCQKIIKKACVERLKEHYNVSWFEETGSKHQIQFGIIKDMVSIYFDTSGPGLHKRGYRKNANDAPIKETLAAGIIDLARVRKDSTVVDPMCGSGTFLIESTLKALNIAPGLRRRFAAEEWTQISDSVWENARAEAKSSIIKDSNFKAFGFDIDDISVDLSQANSRKAGIGSKITVKQADITKFRQFNNSITFCNPPYGERMLELRDAEKLYKILGEKLNPSRDNPCYIISPHEDFEKFFGKKADKRRKLYNGMIKCQLFMYFK